MITVAALLIARQFSSPVVETIAPSSRVIAIEGVVSLPELGAHGWQLMRSMVRAMGQQTSDYQRRDILTITDGAAPVFELMPDHVRISLIVPPGNLKPGLRLLNSLLERSVFERAPDPEPLGSIWAETFQFHSSDARPLSVNEMVALGRFTLRREITAVGVAGPIKPGEAELSWQEVLDANPPQPKAAWREPAPMPPKGDSRNVHVVTIQGARQPFRDAGLPSRLLALMALGTGKGSAMFRICRESMGLSYRQESMLVPTPTGWLPQLAFASTTENLSEEVPKLREALRKDIENWDGTVLARALGAATAVFRLGVPISPLYLTPYGGTSGTLSDQLFLDTYWMSRTGRRFDADGLLASMALTRVDELKDMARQILE